jgi:serine/threonine-protein kinase HipA
MSISGVQPKLAARLSLKRRSFEVTGTGGAYILKPENPLFPEIPANEALTMRAASLAGVDVPLCGMVYDKGGGLVYFVRRFDRVGKGKRAVEDFGQLLGLPRASKYEAAVEDLARVVREHASFPALEMPRLYALLLCNFLLGNEDAHVKNYSLRTDASGVVRLAPAYDLVNTTLLAPDQGPGAPAEETALPLRGKTRNLRHEDFEEHLAREVMGLSRQAIADIRARIAAGLDRAADLIHALPFLSEPMRLRYLFVLGLRRMRLGIPVALPAGEHVGYLHLEARHGLDLARLEVRGYNLVFTPLPGLDRLDGRLVRAVAGPDGTSIREHRP